MNQQHSKILPDTVQLAGTNQGRNRTSLQEIKAYSKTLESKKEMDKKPTIYISSIPGGQGRQAAALEAPG